MPRVTTQNIKKQLLKLNLLEDNDTSVSLKNTWTSDISELLIFIFINLQNIV